MLSAASGSEAQVVVADVILLDHDGDAQLVVALRAADLTRLLAVQGRLWAWTQPG
ncbi:hypothetical protein [Nonomuraea wenchangensis]|uniref:hypothetical protein n=1 Tax=Nonomuraea wenchangensis TaxID=568860 RepID=UPI0033CCFC94